MNPASNTVRKDSRLNKILLVRLDPAIRTNQGSRGRRRRCLFRDLSARRLRGEWVGGRATDSGMLVSLFALQSARGRGGDGRSRLPRLAGASAQDRRWQARSGQTIHQPRRHCSDLMPPSGAVENPEGTVATRQFRQNSVGSRLGQGGNVMTKVLMRSVCVGAILAATGISAASAQQTIAPASATPVPGPMPEILQKYAPVTAERLKKPENGNWLMFRRTYDGWGFSPLEAINRDNVSRLQPVWSFATGQTEGHQAPPIVNNGVMFVATPGNQLLAIEAKTGNVLWRYKRPFPEDMTPLHPTNRGVGLYGDKVYFAAAEAILVALDAKTGKEAWTAKSMTTRRATTCRSRPSSST